MTKVSATGRQVLGSAMQNILVRTTLGAQVREAFSDPYITALDFSTLELAWSRLELDYQMQVLKYGVAPDPMG